jgi:hypothetical protein
VRLGGHVLPKLPGVKGLVAGSRQETGMQQVDAALMEWRQGDCVLGKQWFVHRFNPQQPIADESIIAVNGDTNLAEYEVKGFAVTTQTCDIVKSCNLQKFLEVAALVEIKEIKADVKKEDFLSQIKKGQRPQYAFIPGIAENFLVVDLNRVMTVEKAVVAEWHRIAGCSTDKEIRDLGNALARKRIRFAFPNEFNNFVVHKLQDRIKEKHAKLMSEEGKALRALREIRVSASPSWDASEIDLMFLFIRNENELTYEGMRWDQMLEKWLALIPESGRFKSIEGQVSALEDLTAKEYVESDPLDLDHLSTS